MAQTWTVIGIMATAFAAMIGFAYRTMTEQGKALSAQIECLRSDLDAQIGGLRGEFQWPAQRVERPDEEASCRNERTIRLRPHADGQDRVH
jgi:hypothetical protein